MPCKPITVYTYSGCGSCRKAVKWLREHDVPFQEKPIRETPPSPVELRKMLASQNRELRRLFNTSGQDYRAMDLKDKLPRLTESEAIALLATNGNLVKRPFVLGTGFGLVGFNEKAWAEALNVL